MIPGLAASHRRSTLAWLDIASVGIEHLTYRMSLTSSIILKFWIHIALWWSGIELDQLGSKEINVLRSFFSFNVRGASKPWIS